MKVFVTGVTGYIGFNVACAFRRAGYDVSGLVRSEDKAQQVALQEIRPVIGSMQEPDGFLNLVEQSSIVVHAAVDYKSPDRGVLDKQFTKSLLSACNSGVRPKTFIYTSGVWVYGNTNHQLVDETTPLNPVRLVTWRPAVEEMVTRATGTKGIVLRPGCVYGRSGGMTGEWFKQAHFEKILKIIGDGSNHWAMVDVDDLAGAYVLAAQKAVAGEVYNLVDSSHSNISEMANAAAKVTGFSGKIECLPIDEAKKTWGDYADCLALDQHVDGRKAMRLLGWQPTHTGLVDEIETYFQSWKTAAGL